MITIIILILIIMIVLLLLNNNTNIIINKKYKGESFINYINDDEVITDLHYSDDSELNNKYGVLNDYDNNLSLEKLSQCNYTIEGKVICDNQKTLNISNWEDKKSAHTLNMWGEN
jgi:hypothetical protein